MNLTLMELAANIILIWGQNHVNRGYEEDTLSDQWWPGQQRQLQRLIAIKQLELRWKELKMNILILSN